MAASDVPPIAFLDHLDEAAGLIGPAAVEVVHDFVDEVLGNPHVLVESARFRLGADRLLEADNAGALSLDPGPFLASRHQNPPMGRPLRRWYCAIASIMNDSSSRSEPA